MWVFLQSLVFPTAILLHTSNSYRQAIEMNVIIILTFFSPWFCQGPHGSPSLPLSSPIFPPKESELMNLLYSLKYKRSRTTLATPMSQDSPRSRPGKAWQRQMEASEQVRPRREWELTFFLDYLLCYGPVFTVRYVNTNLILKSSLWMLYYHPHFYRCRNVPKMIE